MRGVPAALIACLPCGPCRAVLTVAMHCIALTLWAASECGLHTLSETDLIDLLLSPLQQPTAQLSPSCGTDTDRARTRLWPLTRVCATVRNLQAELAQMSRNGSSLWIVKPVSSSRGRGIFIVNDVRQIPPQYKAVACRYIANPLLLDRKCDELVDQLGVTVE